MAITEKVLFTWVHVSDLHFGHGNTEHQWDQRVVLKLLLDDVRGAVNGWPELPRVDAVMVTGDVGFSGAARASNEYDQAQEWLDQLVAAIGLEPRDVFIVAGNHDVQRNQAIGLEEVASIRSDPAKLDEVFDAGGGAALLARQENFAAFSKRYGDRDPVAWTAVRELPLGGALRLVGLNTALVAADDADAGKLCVTRRHLATIAGGDSAEITVLLTHHPLSGGWLANEAERAAMVRGHAHIHLCGHTHDPDALVSAVGGGEPLVTVVAASAHKDPREEPSHGYNFASLMIDSRGRLKLKVWPRRWYPKWHAFRVDIHNVPDRAFFDERLLRGTHERHGLRLDPPSSTGLAGSAMWGEAVAWSDLLRGASRLDIVAIACRTLFDGDAVGHLREFLDRKGILRAVLADPTDDDGMARYDAEFATPPGDRKAKVVAALDVACRLADEYRGQVSIRVTQQISKYSAYRIDGDLMFVPYAMRPGKEPNHTPVLVFYERGLIARHYLGPDIDALLDRHSRPISSEEVVAIRTRT